MVKSYFVLRLHVYIYGFEISDYPCYRDYVIVTLPQLNFFDGKEISRTERFIAQQNFNENRRQLIQLQVNIITLIL